ncbi:hypothetical protein GCM10027275_14700 [Rhabdobacter roseus]|uniref:hypothetical protein n=1 Tax=Rhabdobacter roseus TaxID=1655419 RepID=UPI00160A1F54|nr:hypothetical protein [Rhabdobacter roseus]
MKQFYERNSPANFIARISFDDHPFNGTTRYIDIPLSVEEHRRTLYHTNEKTYTDFKFQKIPKILEDIVKELKRINKDS